MDRDAALSRLPTVYEAALRLRDAEVTPGEIAGRLGVDPSAVGSIIAMAEAKLLRLLHAPTPSPPLEARGGDRC